MSGEEPEAFLGIAAEGEAGELSEPQREALALALERLEEAMEGFRRHYGLPISDLEIDLDALSPRVQEDSPRKGSTH